MAKVTINTGANGDEWAEFNINNVLNDEGDLVINTIDSTGTIDIDWGDGTIDTNIVPHPNNHIEHTFTGNSNLLRIRCSEGLEHIKSFYNFGVNILGNISQFSVFPNLEIFTESVGGIDQPVNISDIPSSIIDITLDRIDVTGNVVSLNRNMVQAAFVNQAIYNITGNVIDLPRNLTYCNFYGSSITGDIQELPSTLITFQLINNTAPITGNISKLPNLIETFRIVSNNTITGNIANLPNSLDFIVIKNGSNTLHGNLQDIPNSVRVLNIEGNNIISGDFSSFDGSSILEVNILGNNSINGNLNQITSQELANLKINGNNTITGDISNVNIETKFEIGGNNTIFGDLGTVDDNSQGFPSFFIVGGNHNIRRTTAITNLLSTSFINIQLNTPSQTMPSSEIDDIIADLAAISANATVQFTSVGLNRTSASDADVTTIQSNGGLVNTSA